LAGAGQRKEYRGRDEQRAQTRTSLENGESIPTGHERSCDRVIDSVREADQKASAGTLASRNQGKLREAANQSDRSLTSGY